jgi:5-methylcytosine-specific restriction endonuclease McrA
MAMKHSLTNVDGTTRTGDCAVCGPSVRVKESYTKKQGQKQHYRCYRQFKVGKMLSERPYKIHQKDYCENVRCTATIEEECQLTVDHIDGDHSNNEISNLMTLCVNCHALKTQQNNYFNSYSALRNGQKSLS